MEVRYLYYFLTCTTSIVFFLILICEYLVYYLKIMSCQWPSKSMGTNVLRAVVIADPHLLGLIKGHWFDKLRREWQMRMTYRAINHIIRPKLVFILGDIFDEGQWANEPHFKDYMYTYKSVFKPLKWAKIYGIVGNHDVGFHYHIKSTNEYFLKRFMKNFQLKLVDIHIIQDNIFIIINSMAFEGDKCNLCLEASRQLHNISKLFKCDLNNDLCLPIKNLYMYSKPILMQHFPMFRTLTNQCLYPSSNIPFKPKYDCLSNESSFRIMETIKPRLILSGHTHHDCEFKHHNMIPEITIGSFSWRNSPKPSFLLLETSSSNFTTRLCHGPNENVILGIYYVAFIILAILLGWIILTKLFRRKKPEWKIYKIRKIEKNA